MPGRVMKVTIDKYGEFTMSEFSKEEVLKKVSIRYLCCLNRNIALEVIQWFTGMW